LKRWQIYFLFFRLKMPVKYITILERWEERGHMILTFAAVTIAVVLVLLIRALGNVLLQLDALGNTLTGLTDQSQQNMRQHHVTRRYLGALVEDRLFTHLGIGKRAPTPFEQKALKDWEASESSEGVKTLDVVGV
jgi:hypothetical protein